MNVKAIVTLNEDAISKIEAAKLKATAMLLEALKTDVDDAQVVPFRDGELKDSVSTGFLQQGDKVIAWIGWNTPYARRLYFHPEYNFRTDKHLNAKGLWMGDYQYGPGFEWLKSAYGELLKRESGGVIK